MGRLDAAVLDGRRMTLRDLAARNRFWAFNGVVGRTETPLLVADHGETVRLETRNDTAFPHAMHAHGMHFREVVADGALGPLRDTLLSLAGEARVPSPPTIRATGCCITTCSPTPLRA
jgi:FtsP/CotA-like multicopper oxidase with cupredoxin domain